MLRKHDPNRYWDPYIAGVLLGLLLFLTFFLTGHGLGSSGGVNRILVALEDLVVPRHVDTTPYLAAMAGGERNPLDHWIVWQVAGICSAVSSPAGCAAGCGLRPGMVRRSPLKRAGSWPSSVAY